MFGPGLDLPTWVQDLSPFTHSPKSPAAAVTAAPILMLTAVCVGLLAVGLIALRRRNLVLPA
jgi:ABC-2 type transport system permease protein